MVDPLWFTSYNLAVGIVTSVGVLYFLFVKPTVVEYHRFLIIPISGLVLFLIGGPIAELLFPAIVHWIHGIAALLVILGLYDPVKNNVRHEAWADALLQEPSKIRQPEEWMLPIDDAILGLFHSADLVLTPSIIAYNIDYSRDEVNRRLIELEQQGFVTKVERGKYQITALGRQYLDGSVSYSLRSQLQHLWNATFNR
jgi:predicted transcriptional regulator